MMKEKQIEEIAKVIGDADQRCYEMDCDDCPLNTMELGLCKEKFLAIDIYNAGYRKSTEVAKEIIADLVKFADDKERQMSFHGHSVWYIDADAMTDFITELKKKYLGGDNNVPTDTEEGK